MSVLTLTYSTKSHRKIVHLGHCRIIHRISRDYRNSFESLEEAHAHGYRLCNCCAPVAQRYRKERKAVDAFCKANGYHFKLLDGVIHIISAHDVWRIAAVGRNNKLILCHKNTSERFDKEKYTASIPGFHRQKCQSRTILGYLEIIASHDSYRDERPCTERTVAPDKKGNLPEWLVEKYGKDYLALGESAPYKRVKGTKKYKKAQKKKKKQKRQADIIRVNALLDELAGR